MENINDVVYSLVKTEDELSEARMAKDILTKSDALPLEKKYLNKVVTGGRSNNYMEGYDGIYPRIDMSKIKDATVRKGLHLFPAFATYDVFDNSATCTVTYSVNSRDYSGYTNAEKVKAGVSLLMRPIMWVRSMFNQYSDEAALVGIFISLISQLTWVGVGANTDNLLWMSFWLVISIIGACSLIWHIFAIALEDSEISVSTSYIHEFNGVIPVYIKNRILEHKKKFHKIYLIEEAYDWKTQKGFSFSKIKDPDPLIIGEYGGVHFLLEKFDLTSLEEYFAKEATINLTKE